jgi:hypothetical protein
MLPPNERKEEVMQYLKRNAVAILAGAAIIVGGSYVGAKALSTPQSVTLDSATSSTTPAPATSPAPHGAIRGEVVIQRKDGTFPTIRFNRGTLSSVDGTTLVISEADGSTVRIDTTDQTRFRRDGKRASLSDLQSGDHVDVLGTEVNGTYVTKMVRAFDPTTWNQRQSDRASLRAQFRSQLNGQ